MSPLRAFLRFVYQMTRAATLQDATPGNGDLMSCLWSVKFSPNQSPFEAKLGPWQLFATGKQEFSFLFSEIFVNQDYLVSLNNQQPVIIDCGANTGFAMFYFKLRYPQARITCFEPNPRSFELLKRNVEKNKLTDVNLVQSACGADNGMITLFVDPQNSLVNTTLGERSSTSEEVHVPLVKLSDYIQGPVDLVKIDVEGAEWDVFDDLVKSGKIADIQKLIIEYHHRLGNAPAKLSRFLKILEDSGFTYTVQAKAYGDKFHDSLQDVMLFASRVA